MKWRKIPKAEAEASSTGLIRSLVTSRKKILKQHTNKDKYLVTTIKLENGIWSKQLVHRLVAYAFYGISKLGVNHKDLDKANNKPKNLEYTTQLENVQHAIRNGIKVGGSTKGM